MLKTTLLLLLFIITSCNTVKKESSYELPIQEFGEFYKIENPDFKTNITSKFKMVLDVGKQTNKGNNKINSLLNTGARYLNIHLAAGIPKENLKVALVVHGSASFDVLNNAAYKKKYGIENPNSALLTALKKAGAQVIICGQSATYHKIERKDLHPAVAVALSAMTALVQLQHEEYRLVRF